MLEQVLKKWMKVGKDINTCIELSKLCELKKGFNKSYIDRNILFSSVYINECDFLRFALRDT
jgi:hypothetical protein